MTEMEKAKEIEGKVIERTHGAAGIYLDPIYGLLVLSNTIDEHEVPYEDFLKTMCVYYHQKSQERGYLWMEKLEDLDDDTLKKMCYHYMSEAMKRGLVEKPGENA